MKKEKKQKVKKERKKSTFWVDFKAFISRGNIVDLAVAVVVGAAFTAIVNSLVNDIIKPCIALLVNGNLSELAVVLRPAELAEDGVTVITQAITLNYGNLIMSIFTFLIDAFVIFTAIRIVRNARKKLKEGAEMLKDKLNGDDDEVVEETVEETVVVEETPASASESAPASEPTPAVDLETVALLKEIRDLLKADKKEETKIDDNK